jgi:hypothetical protein
MSDIDKAVKKVLDWWEKAQYDTYGTVDGDEENTYGTDEECMFGELKAQYNTPPMPKVKDPKPEGNPPLPRKEVISIQPGDVIAVTSSEGTTEKNRNGAADLTHIAFPDNSILLLPNGMSLEVYREQDKDDKCPCECETCDKLCVNHSREQVKE